MRRTIAAAAVALMLGLTAACGGGDDDTAGPRPSASATTTTPTAETWTAEARPQRPADQQGVEGAQQFAEFAANTVFYMMATSDVPALTSIADLGSCETCREWSNNYDDGKINKQSILSGPVTYELAEKPTVNDDVFYQVKLTMDVPAGESVVTTDGKKKTTNIDAAEALPFTADLQWKDDQWVLLRYQLG
ncbi:MULTISPECIES: DUF6318 family protein [unclassified Aeromicrobium]|uniref:DUF6318 family protein n=1 Tax=unclassified Aeromicrobium TaxID=2633570 RepID=UPI00396AF76C